VKITHPLSVFLSIDGSGDAPSLARLNELAAQRGLPVKFTLPADDGLSYEERIFRTGAVATRNANAHDLFNALVWLAFPQTKAVLNRRHVEALRGQGGVVRGTLRDALTQFDECGVIVMGTNTKLWEAICAHRWQEVFVAQRAELKRTTRFIVFGHASHEALMAPFQGLCGKALFLPVTAAMLARFDHGGLAGVDALLARRLASADFSPHDWQPLPLLGIPGATVENEAPDYYADTRQFRPPRTMRAGSSPGNRWSRKWLEESPGPTGRDAG